MSSVRRWAARLLMLGVALASVVALALIVAVTVLDNDDYRDLLVWAAESYLDARLAIDGELSIELGPTLALRAQGLGLQTNDGRLTASVTDLDTRLQLKPLLSKTLWFDNLTIVGARFDLGRPSQPDSDRRAARAGGLPKIIVAQARLLDVALAYRDAEGEPHEGQIDQLLIDDPLDEGPIAVVGRGQLNDRPIELAGTLGAHRQLTDETVPYPVDLSLRSDALSIKLAGTIADPARGQGVKLQVRADDPDLAASLALLGYTVPALGALDLEAEISGHYDALALEGLRLSLRRSDEVDIRLVGRMANLQALSGAELRVEGAVDDAALWQWLTFGKLTGFDRGVFSGTVTDQTDALRITDLGITTSSQTGLNLEAKGVAAIPSGTTAIAEADIDLAVSLSAPSHAALEPVIEHGIPELGPVELSARVTGRLPLIEFEALNVSVGHQGDHRYVLKNGEGRLDLREDPVLQQASGPMTLTTPAPDRLAGLFGIDLPRLGQTTATSVWRVDGTTIKVDDLDSEIRLAGDATHKLAGTIVHEIGKRTQADLRFDLDTDRLLAIWLQNTPGQLGRIAGTLELWGDQAGWHARRFELTSTGTDLFAITIAGQDGSQGPGRPQQMSLRLSIDDPPRLFETTGLETLPLAPIEADGTLTASQGSYRYDGDLHVGTTTSQLDVVAAARKGRPIIKGEFRTPRLTLADFGLQVEETPGEQTNGVGKAAEPSNPDIADVPPTADPLFSREPYDLAWLRTLDLDLMVEIDELRGVELEIDEIDSRISLASGHLRLDQADFQYLGGRASGTFELDARATPVLKVDIKAEDLVFSDILAEFLPDTFEGGILDLKLKLEGRGNSPHALVSSLDGGLDMAFENTSMPASYVQFLSADVFGWTLSQTALANQTSFIDCGIIGLDAESGTVTSRALLADGPQLSISGDISLDLGSETLDMVVLPERKKLFSVFNNATPVKLSGSLRNPTVEAIPAKAAAQRVGGLVLLPQVFIPLEALTQVTRLFSRRADGGEGCTQVLGRSVNEGFAFEGVTPPAASRTGD